MGDQNTGDRPDTNRLRQADEQAQQRRQCFSKLSPEESAEPGPPLEVQQAETPEGGCWFPTASTDINEGKQAEEALRLTEESLRRTHLLLDTLLTTAPVGFAYLDRELRCVLVNDRLAEIDGIPPAAHLGKRVHEIIPTAIPIIEEVVSRILATGKPVKDHEFTGETAPLPGVTQFFNESWYPVRDDSGEIVGFGVIVEDITERKWTEQTLHESEERLRLASKATSDVIWDWDIATDLVRWNDAMMTVFGWSEAVAHPQPVAWWRERVHPEDRMRVNEGLLAAIESRDRDHWQDEYRFLKNDGAYAFVLDRGSVMRDAQGKAVRMVGAILDLTGRKQVEESLRLSEARLAVVASGTKIGMFDWDVATGAILHTEQLARLLGFSSPSLPSSSLSLLFHYSDWCERIHPEDLPRVESEWRRCAEEHLPFALEYRVLWPDGSEHWMTSRGAFQYDENDQPQRMLGILMDITEQKRTEETLRESEERFRALVTASSEVLYRMSPDWNEMRYFHSRNYPGVSEGTCRTWLQDYMYPEEQPRIREAIQKAIRTKGTFELEHRARRLDGTMGWVASRAVPLLDAQGEIVEWFGAATDITERKLIEEQLKALNDTLEERVRERTAEAHWRANQLQRLAAQMTQAEERERRRLAQVLHDHLQQLLVAARLRLGRAANRLSDEPAIAAIAEAMGLVDEAIGESRSLTKELSPPVLYDRGLAAGLEWLAREVEKKHQLPVAVEVAAEMEPDDLTTRVFVFQAARELLLNAVKHAQASSLSIRLSRADDDRLQVVVEDDGTGFDTETVKGNEGQGGFGLFSVRERLDVIGGELTIVSTLRRGTKATIIAPCRRTPSAPIPAGVAKDHARVPSKVPAGRSTRIRVLLADDHPVLRKGLAEMLVDHPELNLVGEAQDGQEAFELALQVRPDVVLMDISMPRMDGIESTRRIKQAMPEVAVIGFSMHESDDVAAAMRSAGATQCLTKTVPTEDLISTILRACPQR